ncbi:hypothetical protein PG5_50640 [Pseudomonas sp. G5(2012)]|nr:hypothetical protein PG5_50640 [Pseudomonas sp. G5(2012)]
MSSPRLSKFFEVDFSRLLGAQWAEKLLALFSAEVTRAKDKQWLVEIG